MSFDVFVSEFSAKRAQVRADDLAATPKPKGKAKAKAAVAAPPRRLLPDFADDVKHSDVKQYMPSDSYLWRSNTDGAWNCRVGYFPTVSRAWAKYGMKGSLRRVVTIAWHQHCQLHGIAAADCPMIELDFSDEFLSG